MVVWFGFDLVICLCFDLVVIWYVCVCVCCRYEYLFKFDNTFEIHDDIEVLKRMGMALGLEKGSCTPENIARATKLVPKVLEPYVIGKCLNCAFNVVHWCQFCTHTHIALNFHM